MHGLHARQLLVLLLFGALAGCSGPTDSAPPADDSGADSGGDTGAPPPPAGLESAGATFLGAPSAAAGGALSGPGDIDGDGVDDLVITAFYANLACIWHGPVAPGPHLLAAADACLTGENAYDFAGYAVAAPGDVDGDGRADLLISAGGNDDGGADAGKAYLFTAAIADGGASFSVATTAFTGESAGDYAGISLAGAGDVNGDGARDLLVGASGNDAGGGGAGRVYLLHGPFVAGTTSLVDASVTFTGTSIVTPARMHGASTGGDAVGDSVAGAGDVNGDGLGDLLIGVSGADGLGEDTGEAWLFYGPVTDGDHVAADADVRLIGPDPGAFAGGALTGPGDLDGDGTDDLAISADGQGGGHVYVLLAPFVAGTSALADGAAAFVGGDAELLGWSVSGPGDMDGDGRRDLVIGAPGNDGSASDAGGIYVVTDPAAPGVRAIADAGRLLGGEAASDAAGRATAAAGDIDEDGLSDVLTGAIYNQEGGVFAGKAYLVTGASFAEP